MNLMPNQQQNTASNCISCFFLKFLMLTCDVAASSPSIQILAVFFMRQGKSN
jgi:hypothetical protein